MSKQDKRRVSNEEVSSIEADMYEHVERFFHDEKKCEKTGSASSSSISLRIFGGIAFPDAYGVKNPTNPSFEIYMAEGKRDFGGRNFDICKGQAISLQRFADYVYLFFPKDPWSQLTDKERGEVTQECRTLKLGLILVDGNSCEEVVSAFPNTDLLEDERKAEAKDLMIHYFPSFASEANAQFFERFSGLAINVAGESYKLLNECKDVFREKTGGSPVHTHIYYERDEEYFQIAFQNESTPCDFYLTISPFGHPQFGNDRPLLILEQWFPFTWYAKRSKIDALLDHIEKCMELDSEVEVISDAWGPTTVEAEQLSEKVKKSPNQVDKIVIYQPIEASGREIKKIVGDVRKSLDRLESLLKSAQKRSRRT